MTTGISGGSAPRLAATFPICGKSPCVENPGILGTTGFHRWPCSKPTEHQNKKPCSHCREQGFFIFLRLIFLDAAVHVRVVLGCINRAPEIRVGHAKNEELAGVGARAAEILEKVIVVREPEGVHGLPVKLNVRTEGEALELGRDLVGGDAVIVENFDDIEEKSFGNGQNGSVSTVEAGNVHGVRNVDLKDLFNFCFAAVAKTFAVAFVYEKFVVVDGSDVAYAGTCGEEVSELVSGLAGLCVNGYKAKQTRSGTSQDIVLDRRCLQHADN